MRRKLVLLVTAALLTVLSSGDELLMTDGVYGPTRRFCDGFLKRYGVATRYYDPMAGAGIAGLIGERTCAIFLESPGSLTMEVQDVPAICAAAKARNPLRGVSLGSFTAAYQMCPAVPHA